jgi:hypothetical protein
VGRFVRLLVILVVYWRVKSNVRVGRMAAASDLKIREFVGKLLKEVINSIITIFTSNVLL